MSLKLPIIYLYFSTGWIGFSSSAKCCSATSSSSKTVCLVGLVAMLVCGRVVVGGAYCVEFFW